LLLSLLFVAVFLGCKKEEPILIDGPWTRVDPRTTDPQTNEVWDFRSNGVLVIENTETGSVREGEYILKPVFDGTTLVVLGIPGLEGSTEYDYPEINFRVLEINDELLFMDVVEHHPSSTMYEFTR